MSDDGFIPDTAVKRDDGFIPDTAVKHDDGFIPDSNGGLGDKVMSIAKQSLGSFPNSVATAASLAAGPQEALGTLSALKANEQFGEGTDLLGGNTAEWLAKKGVPVPLAATAGFVAQNAPYFLLPTGEAKAIPIAEDVATTAGRRALGFTKRFLKNPGDLEKANAVAKTMTEEGVITNPLMHPFSSGTKSMIDRAEALKEKSGKSITNLMGTLDQQGVKSFDTGQVARQIIDQLSPKYKGGAYDAERNVVEEIKNTVMAHGEGPIDFKSAQALKEKLQELGKFNSNTDQVKANLYRQASGIVRKALESSVDEATLPVIQSGAKTGRPHALLAYSDNFGPEGARRNIYNVYGDPSNPIFKKTGWGSSLPIEEIEKSGIPIVGKQPNAGPNIQAPNYLKDKAIYGRSKMALKALQNRLSSEEGNNRIGLRQAGLAAGELITGHPIAAAATLGATGTLGRLGNAALATNLSPVSISPVFLRALVAARNKRGELLGQN